MTCAPEIPPIAVTMSINAKPTYIDDRTSDANRAVSVKMNVPMISAMTMLIKLLGNVEPNLARLLLLLAAADSVTTRLTVVLVSVLAVAVFFAVALTGAYFEVFFLDIFTH